MGSGSSLLGDPFTPGGDPGEPGIGVIPDPAPVGEPLVLLVLVLLYAGYVVVRRRRARNA